MPLGKSGQYYMNPHEMRRKNDMPGEAKPMQHAGRPHSNEGGEMQEGEGGDGNHHHELHGHEDGTMHSVHTHPDGREEHADHDSYSEAVSHMHGMFGEEGGGHEEDEERGGKPPMSGKMRGGETPVDMDDMAGMYEKAGRG